MPTYRRCMSIAMLHVCPLRRFQIRVRAESSATAALSHTRATRPPPSAVQFCTPLGAPASAQAQARLPRIVELAHRVALRCVRPCPSRKNAALQVCNAAIRVAFAMRPVRPSLRSSASVDGRGRPSVRPSTFRRTRVPMRAHHHRAPIGTD